MALVINAAVVGGNRLKPEVLKILDDGRFADQTSFVRKIVNGLFSDGNSRYRSMKRNEHKGYFENLDEEITDYCTPPKEENFEMPQKGKPLVREQPKIGRNDPCPCGSGKNTRSAAEKTNSRSYDGAPASRCQINKLNKLTISKSTIKEQIRHG